MIDQRLFNYIEQELKRGVPDIAVKKALKDVGWEESLIKQAFNVVQSRVKPPHPEIGITEDRIIRHEEFDKEWKTKNGFPAKVIVITLIVIITLAIGWYFIFFLPGQKEPLGILNKWEVATENGSTNKKDDGYLAVPEKSLITGNGNNLDKNASATTTAENVSGKNNNSPASIIQSQITQNESSEDNPEENNSNPELEDRQRRADLDKLASVQQSWFAKYAKYYTCGLRGGDCGGRPYGFPEKIDPYLEKISQDPLIGNYADKRAVCGSDYVYCGLNNAPYPNFFCYYAKMEGGGYYAVSQGGAVKRSVVPKTFEECATSN